MHAPNVLRKINTSQPAPRDSDAIPEGMCLNCGITSPMGKHDSLEACIDALRDRIAELE